MVESRQSSLCVQWWSNLFPETLRPICLSAFSFLLVSNGKKKNIIWNIAFWLQERNPKWKKTINKNKNLIRKTEREFALGATSLETQRNRTRCKFNAKRAKYVDLEFFFFFFSMNVACEIKVCFLLSFFFIFLLLFLFYFFFFINLVNGELVWQLLHWIVVSRDCLDTHDSTAEKSFTLPQRWMFQDLQDTFFIDRTPLFSPKVPPKNTRITLISEWERDFHQLLSFYLSPQRKKFRWSKFGTPEKDPR